MTETMITYTMRRPSGFSFARVVEFGRYYYPRLKRQMLLYVLLSLALGLLCLIPGSQDMQVGLFTIVWTVLPMLYYCSPLIFAKGADTRIIDRLLPVTALEKMVFFYFYLLIVIPILTFFIPWICGEIYIHTPDLQTEIVKEFYSQKFGMGTNMITFINLAGLLLITLGCFLVVEWVRHNRILWGIVTVIGANTIIGIIGVIIGGAAAFKAGLHDGLAGKESINQEELVENMLDAIGQPNALTISALVVEAVIVLAIIYMTYRVIKRKNL